MLHKIAIGIALCVLTTLSIAQSPEVTRIYFDYDKFDLKQEGRQALMSLSRSETCTYIITGHTDSRGSNAYNKELSKNRMEEVRLFLLDNGVTVAQIESQYFGEEQPWRTGEDEESWRVNRRVDVLCTCPVEKIPVAEAVEESVEELLALLHPKASTYYVSADRDTALYLEKGGILHLDPNDLAGVEPDAEVEIRVTEYYSLSDMILGHLNTRWGDKMLESGGMVYIEVLADGKAVDLKPGKEYQLRIPTAELQSDMSMWYGTNSESRGLGWLPAGPMGQKLFGGGFSATTTSRRRPGKFKMFMHRMFNRAEWSYWKKLDKKLEEEKEEALDNIEEIEDLGQAGVQYYLLTPSRFGYINCDRFVRRGRTLVNVKTALFQKKSLTAQLLLPDYKSIMPAYVFEGQIGFPNIPGGMRCELVAFKVEDGEYYLGRRTFQAQQGEEIDIEDWEKLTLEEIKAQIKRLDNA